MLRKTTGILCRTNDIDATLTRSVADKGAKPTSDVGEKKKEKPIGNRHNTKNLTAG